MKKQTKAAYFLSQLLNECHLSLQSSSAVAYHVIKDLPIQQGLHAIHQTLLLHHQDEDLPSNSVLVLYQLLLSQKTTSAADCKNKALWDYFITHLYTQYRSKVSDTRFSILARIENRVKNRLLRLDSRFLRDSSNQNSLCLVLSNSLSTVDTQLLRESTSNNLCSSFVQSSNFSQVRKIFVLYKITNSTQRLILARNSWTMQIAVDNSLGNNSSGNLLSFARLGWYFASKPLNCSNGILHHLNSKNCQFTSWTWKAIHDFLSLTSKIKGSLCK